MLCLRVSSEPPVEKPGRSLAQWARVPASESSFWAKQDTQIGAVLYTASRDLYTASHGIASRMQQLMTGFGLHPWIASFAWNLASG
jgi:hypothetical protein